MALYSSANGCNGPFAQVACNDDAGGLKSAISTMVTGGTSYFIVVWVSQFSAPLTNGQSAVQLKVTRPSLPPNDTCAGAEIIPGSGPFPYLTAVSDLTLATTTGDPPAPSCQTKFSRSVWYKFIPNATTTYTLSTCTDTATTVYDTLMAIYNSSAGCGGPYTAIACNDNSCNSRAAITTALNSGVAYYIVIWEVGTDPYTPGETSLQLRVSGLFPPSVLTMPASSITSTGAVMNAIVNPNGVATTAWFDWGTTTNFSNSTVPQPIGSGSSNIAVSTPLTGLSGNLNYFFRVRATNLLGTTAGTNLGFVWGSSRPVLVPTVPSNHVAFGLSFTGAAHQQYLVLASSNLFDWVSIGSATANANGSFNFVDVNSATNPRRFYRVLLP